MPDAFTDVREVLTGADAVLEADRSRRPGLGHTRTTLGEASCSLFAGCLAG